MSADIRNMGPSSSWSPLAAAGSSAPPPPPSTRGISIADDVDDRPGAEIVLRRLRRPSLEALIQRGPRVVSPQAMVVLPRRDPVLRAAGNMIAVGGVATGVGGTATYLVATQFPLGLAAFAGTLTAVVAVIGIALGGGGVKVAREAFKMPVRARLVPESVARASEDGVAADTDARPPSVRDFVTLPLALHLATLLAGIVGLGQMVAIVTSKGTLSNTSPDDAHSYGGAGICGTVPVVVSSASAAVLHVLAVLEKHAEHEQDIELGRATEHNDRYAAAMVEEAMPAIAPMPSSHLPRERIHGTAAAELITL
jgi:hypothetical protein